MNKLKRVIRRLYEELNSICTLLKYIGFSNTRVVFKSKLINHNINKKNSDESSYDIKILMTKHKIMLDYFNKQFKEFTSTYKINKNLKESTKSNYIWICWWQGLDDAPYIVKKCIRRIKKYANSYPVIVLTLANYKDYIDVPSWIEEKFSNGIISYTHYSDYLRIKLLSEYGGIWLDSTFYCNDLNIEKILSSKIWSIKRPGYGHLSVACGQFANYSFAANKEYRWVFCVIKDYLEEYWRINDKLIDYLFLDYLIVLIRNQYSEINEIFNDIENNNPRCDDLQKLMNDEFDEKIWNNLIENTELFKLSWKRNYIDTVNGKDTFYKKLIVDELV